MVGGEAVEAPPDAATKKMAKTLAIASGVAVSSGVFGERRFDEHLPSVYAEQGVTAARYARVKACIKCHPHASLEVVRH